MVGMAGMADMADMEMGIRETWTWCDREVVELWYMYEGVRGSQVTVHEPFSQRKSQKPE